MGGKGGLSGLGGLGSLGENLVNVPNDNEVKSDQPRLVRRIN